MEAPIRAELEFMIASAEGKQVLFIRTRGTGSRGKSGRSGSAFAEAGDVRAACGEAGRWTKHSQEWLCHLQGRQRPYARGRGDEISSNKHYTAGVKRLVLATNLSMRKSLRSPDKGLSGRPFETHGKPELQKDGLSYKRRACETRENRKSLRCPTENVETPKLHKY